MINQPNILAAAAPTDSASLAAFRDILLPILISGEFLIAHAESINVVLR